MEKRMMGIGRILTMVVFVLSCFGLILFLWATFGGSVPFQPHGYRFKASFTEANQLTKESDVRISGLNVGKVKKVELAGERAQATIEMDEEYAPVPLDTRAALRTKTLLSEAYVELTPGDADTPTVPEGGELPIQNIDDAVELDRLLLAFDPKTRRAWRVWLKDSAIAFKGRGWDMNIFIASLASFSEEVDRFAAILNRHDDALELLVKNGSQVFASLSESGRLGSLIESSNSVFAATASRDQQLAETFRQLPKFLDESKASLVRFRRFARDTDPLMRKLRPVAKNLRPVMADTREVAPDLARLVEGLGPLFDASRKGIPGLNRVIDESRPLLAQVYPFLLTLNPTIEWIAQYKRETTASLGNAAATLQATDVSATSATPTHYARIMIPMHPESFAAYPARLPSNRANAYSAPGAFDQLSTGLPVFNSTSCSTAPLTTVAATDPAELKELMDRFIFNLGSAMAPPCVPQPNFNFQGKNLHFPHVEPETNQATSSRK